MSGAGTASQLCPYPLAGVAAAGSTVPSHLEGRNTGWASPRAPPGPCLCPECPTSPGNQAGFRGKKKKVFVLQVASTAQVAVNKGFWKQITLGFVLRENFAKMLTHSSLLTFFFFNLIF